MIKASRSGALEAVSRTICVILLLPSACAWSQTAGTNGKLINVVRTGAAQIATAFPSLPVIGSLIGDRLNVSALNAGLAAELSNLPASSSASALRYTFDPSVGAYVPSQQSLGPILTERAETLGKDKLFIGVTYQRFRFDNQDGVDLRRFVNRLPIQIPVNGTVIQGTGTVAVAIGLNVDEATANLTYGLTSWLDLSYAFSTLTTSVSFQADANVSIPAAGINGSASGGAHGASTGIGDGIARVKAKVYDRNGLALAIATDLRVPTGDEFNLQGAGAYGIKPFVICSYTTRSFSPHINAGYQWNGKSYLASSDNSTRARLPSQLSLAGGADIALSKRTTVSVDVLDQVVLHGPGLRPVSENIGGVEYSYIDFQNRTRHEVNGAGGLKVMIARNLVLSGNLLFRVNSSGLRSGVVPLLGVSYLF